MVSSTLDNSETVDELVLLLSFFQHPRIEYHGEITLSQCFFLLLSVLALFASCGVHFQLAQKSNLPE